MLSCLTLSRGQLGPLPLPSIAVYPDVLQFSSLRGSNPVWSKTQRGKHNLAKHRALRLASGKAGTDKLCASNFTRALLGSEGSVPAVAAHLSRWGLSSSLLACLGSPSCPRAPLSWETQAVVLGMANTLSDLKLAQWLLCPNQVIAPILQTSCGR